MSDGICDFSIEAECDEPADVFNACMVTARLAHTCTECGIGIPPGQRYERIGMKYDGHWSVDRICFACSEISREFFDGARCIGVLWDEIEHNWDEGAHLQACLNRLTTVGAKEHMRRRWLKWKGLSEKAGGE
jgi:hypothetical protein